MRRMKLKLASVAVTLVISALSASTVACGGGQPARAASDARAAEATNVLAAMEAELSHAIPGTTTLTSAEFSSAGLPDSRGSLAAAARQAEPSAPAAKTWGSPPESAAAPAPAEPGAASIYDPNLQP